MDILYDFGKVDKQRFTCHCGEILTSLNFSLFHLLNLCEEFKPQRAASLQPLVASLGMNCLFEKTAPFKSLALEFGTFTVKSNRVEHFHCNCGKELPCSRGLLCSHFNICPKLSNEDRNGYIHLLREMESKTLKWSLNSKRKDFKRTNYSLPNAQKLWKTVSARYGEFSSGKINIVGGTFVIKYKYQCEACNISINDSKPVVIYHLTKGCQKLTNLQKIKIDKEMKGIIVESAAIDFKSKRDINSMAVNPISEMLSSKEDPKFVYDYPISDVEINCTTLDQFKEYLSLKISVARTKNKQLDRKLMILKKMKKLNTNELKTLMSTFSS